MSRTGGHSGTPRRRLRATVFGLDVLAPVSLSLLQGAGAPATGRELELSITAPGAPVPWPSRSERISEEREADGDLLYEIRADPEAGYLISGARYGAHVLSADGRRLVCSPSHMHDVAWQRLLLAQVLPFAAVLRGLEVFHASAVCIGGRAVAFAGPSRSGKTSLALACAHRGATFLADDVLAVEPAGHVALAHPGSPVAGVARAEQQRIAAAPTAAAILGENERELLVSVDPASAPTPLAAVFFLQRSSDGPQLPRFEPVADAGTLLTATFNFLLADERRLRRLLDVCALIAAGRVERLLAGLSLDASRLACAVTERLRAPS